MPAESDAPAPELGETAVPAVIPCHPKDLATLPFCVASLREHPQVTDIRVIAPRAVEPTCDRLGVGFIDELAVLEHWFDDHMADEDQHWYYQQLLKYSVAFLDDLGSDRFLIIDADTVFLRSSQLVDPRSGIALEPRLPLYFRPYWVGMRELLGYEPTYEGSYTSHYMVFRSSLVRAMFAEFARVAGRPPEDGVSVFREFLRTCDRVNRSHSDYETYGHFLREHCPSEMGWSEARQLNVLYVAPDPAVIDRLRPYYDYCNFHAYRRPDRWALRVAGSTWLNVRIARDRLAHARPLSAVAGPGVGTPPTPAP